MTHSKNDDIQSTWPQRFSVRVDRDKVVDFIKCVSRQDNIPLDNELKVPKTFAASWFGQSDVELCVLNSIGNSLNDEQHITLHVAQNITTTQNLQIGKDYFLDIEGNRSIGDGKFEVFSKVRDLTGAVQLELCGVFIIIDTSQAAR